MTMHCPHVRLRHFWGPDLPRRRLSFAQDRRDDFVPGRIITRTDAKIDTRAYSALNIHNVGDLGKEGVARLRDMAPALTKTLGLPPRQFQGGAFRSYDFSPTPQDADFIDFTGWLFGLVMVLRRAPVA